MKKRTARGDYMYDRGKNKYLLISTEKIPGRQRLHTDESVGSKALNARYVMLHNGTNGILFKLKGVGPRFMSKETLQKKGFESLGHDYYLVYTFDTTQSKDYNNLSALARGKQTTAPWFATWEELMQNNQK